MPIGEKRKDRNAVSAGMVQPIQYLLYVIAFDFDYSADDVTG